MSAPNDGGPAFPVPSDGRAEGDPGMSLRDWFAGQAMDRFKFGGYARSEVESVRAAEAAYRIADAMLAARSLDSEELARRSRLDAQTPDWRKAK